MDYQPLIDKYYESGSRLREILILHSRQVAQLALEIAKEKRIGLDPKQIEAAAMLHDIGICLCHAPGICCEGDNPYLQHGLLGAELLRKEGAPEWTARVAERHTGAGLTAEEIKAQSLPLPAIDLMPETELERLICYADKFYSKSGDMQRKPFDRVRASMAKFGPGTLDRFDALAKEFGIR